MTNGESAFKTFGCLGTIIAALVVLAFALIAIPSIEESQSDQAKANASIENAKAAAVAAQAQAQVDEAQVEADASIQMQLDRQAHELALLREENRQFQERLVMLATVVEHMDSRKVDRLSQLLGEDGTSPAALMAALGLGFVCFLIIVWLWATLRKRIQAWTPY